MVYRCKRDSNSVEQERARENDTSRAQCHYAEILRKTKIVPQFYVLPTNCHLVCWRYIFKWSIEHTVVVFIAPSYVRSMNIESFHYPSAHIRCVYVSPSRKKSLLARQS